MIIKIRTLLLEKYIYDAEEVEKMKAAVESGPKKRASLNEVAQLTNNDLQQVGEILNTRRHSKRLIVNTTPLESMNINNYQRRLNERKNERNLKAASK